MLETALYVSDPERSEAFYRRLLGARPVMREDRIHALELADRRILLLFRRGQSSDGVETLGGFIPGHDGWGVIHLAFETEDLPGWEVRLSLLGIEVESDVTPMHGGRSLYFRDPDGHAIEFADRLIWDRLPPIA